MKLSKIVAKSILLLGVFALASCGKDYAIEEPPISKDLIPEALQDCKFFQLRNSGHYTLHVVRCPNSVVSTLVPGKYPQRTITIDKDISEENLMKLRQLEEITEQIKKLQDQKSQILNQGETK